MNYGNGEFEGEPGLTAGASGLTRPAAARDGPARYQPSARGTTAARINITSNGRPGGVEFTQSRLALVQGKSYKLGFSARADHPMEISCVASKASPASDNYGLDQDVRLTDGSRLPDF